MDDRIASFVGNDGTFTTKNANRDWDNLIKPSPVSHVGGSSTKPALPTSSIPCRLAKRTWPGVVSGQCRRPAMNRLGIETCSCVVLFCLSPLERDPFDAPSRAQDWCTGPARLNDQDALAERDLQAEPKKKKKRPQEWCGEI